MQAEEEAREEGDVRIVRDYMDLDQWEQVVELRNKLSVAGFSHRELYIFLGEEWEAEVLVVMAYDSKWLSNLIKEKDIKAALEEISDVKERKIGEIDYYYHIVQTLNEYRITLQGIMSDKPTLKERVSNRSQEIKSELASVEAGDRVELLRGDMEIILCLYPSKIINNPLPSPSPPDRSHHYFGLTLLLLLVAGYELWSMDWGSL